jgi:hypothetical protein
MSDKKEELRDAIWTAIACAHVGPILPVDERLSKEEVLAVLGGAVNELMSGKVLPTGAEKMSNYQKK